MGTCFVIQPFDGGPFDKRYEDIIDPAIRDAGLEPYRVDRDPSANIPIDQIEDGIRKSDACLADITTHNPNVWFELGYAIAARKEVVLVCAHNPELKFPFDIQHRAIIRYETESARDFDKMKAAITLRLQAILKKEETIDKASQLSPIADVEGLTQHEMVTLATVASNIERPMGKISAWSIRQDMERAGYTKIAVTLGLTSLQKKSLIMVDEDMDQNGEPFAVYGVTDSGMNWLLQNQDRFVLRRKKSPPKDTEDVPF